MVAHMSWLGTYQLAAHWFPKVQSSHLASGCFLFLFFLGGCFGVALLKCFFVGWLVFLFLLFPYFEGFLRFLF